MSATRSNSAAALPLWLTRSKEGVHRAYVGGCETQRTVTERGFQGEECFCKALKSISLDAIKSSDSIFGTGRNFNPETKTVIANVMQFFGKIKEHLGERARGTIFERIGIITAVACGVSQSTVSRVKKCVGRPVTARKIPKARSRRAVIKSAIDKFGPERSERLKQLVHGMLKEEKDVTVQELRQHILVTYPDLTLSETTLWRLMKGLGFSYKLLKGQRFIFERADLSLKRSPYLSKVKEARERGDCVVYMDETWVFEGMVKRKGWVDTTMPRFPSAEMMRNYSCGKTAGKTKGKRGIVITALSEDGIVPGCTHVLLSGYRTTQDDYHREMDHVAFESWQTSSIPLMKGFAAGRNVSLVLDNAPYHTRALQKIPTASSTKQEILDYLALHGIEVAMDSTKALLLEELNYFVESRGGLASLRCYAAEKICSDLGVTLIRLPPFHCFFNPVESCWSYLKHRLNKIGRPSDKLETVRSRTLEILGNLPRQLCEGWCREALREEDAARLKEVLDAGNQDGGSVEVSSLSDFSSDGTSEESLTDLSTEL